MSEAVVIKIVKENGAFVLTNEEGGFYGKADTLEEAEALRGDWIEYYESQLPQGEN